jgi:phosphatidylinositol 4-kinase B
LHLPTLHPPFPLLKQYSDQKTVFEGIEFYLPQLAHMIIHLEVDWPTAALEQFVLIVCQHRCVRFPLPVGRVWVCPSSHAAFYSFHLMTPFPFATHPNPRSLHFALQLHFILVGAMEDYQLEGSDGRRTAYGNPRYYRRCAKLLQNVHRCVVYGAPRVRHVSRGIRIVELKGVGKKREGVLCLCGGLGW